MNEKIAFCLSLQAVVTIALTVAAVYAKSEVAGGYDTGFERCRGSSYSSKPI
jgi:hypothetical protein